LKGPIPLVPLFVALFLACAGRGQTAYPVEFEKEVAVKMRDGVTLRADIYRPRADGRFPVILERTPYDKFSEIHHGMMAAERGYVFIVQDVRGRYGSEGEWYPFRHEGQDTYDTVEWAASLRYSDGKVGMTGGSYVGVPLLLGAIEQPPHLVAIYPSVTDSNYHSHWAYRGGAFMQLLAQGWANSLSANELARRAEASPPPYRWGKLLPPVSFQVLDPGLSVGLGAFYFDWLAHPSYDAYWKQWSIEEHYAKIQVPALHLAAWYDIFQEGSLRNYVGIKELGGSEAARTGQRLIVIPGGHAGFGRKIGVVDFGAESVFDSWGYGMRWFDWRLKGVDDGISREKPVRIFVMGTNVWRDEDDWPLARAKSTRFFLHSAGKANSRGGDGTLAEEVPGDEPDDRYTYDPGNPVPTHGGAILGDSETYPPGPLDQSSVEERADVLLYKSAVFRQNTEVTGPVSLELYVSSSAVDTDFTAKLVDVGPKGFAQNLTDGVLRARYRNSMETPEMMKPGAIYKVTVELGSTANVFLAGHRLAIEVSSSNYPRCDRNPNTGESPEASAGYLKAENRIHHDRDHPSVLILPIVPQAGS
jgi:putative CocE/NonD family hydrolase